MFVSRYQTLTELFERSTQTFGPRPLFGVKRGGAWTWMRYAEFATEVEKMRAALHALDIGQGARVAVISDNRPEWASAAFAAYGLGATFVPMYESQSPMEWNYILRDASVKVVCVSSPRIADAVIAGKQGLPELQHVIVFPPNDPTGTPPGAPAVESPLRGADENTPPCQRHELMALFAAYPAATAPATLHPDPESMAGLIYTSGTTGVPKGVMLSHRNLVSNVSAVMDVHPMSPDDRSLSFLPWAHCFGQVAELYGLMARGASMAIVESTPRILDNLMEIKPTVLISVPRIFNRIYDRVHQRVAEDGGVKKALFTQAMRNARARAESIEQHERPGLAVEVQHRMFDRLVFKKIRDRFGGQLRFTISGGAALSPKVAAFIDVLGIKVYEGYGLTETSPVVAVNGARAERRGSVGRPIPGVTVHVDHAVTGDPREGELIVEGHCVMQGYLGLPEEDAKVLEGKRFRTGDLGYVDADGYVFITGRIKERYKLENGKYVAPVPLEEMFKTCPSIASIMVYGDNKPHNVAIVYPDLESLGTWAEKHNVDLRKPERWTKHASLKERILREIREASSNIKQYERIRDIALIGEDFSVENGMLTPSLKAKRRVVIKHYASLLDALYQKPGNGG